MSEIKVIMFSSNTPIKKSKDGCKYMKDITKSCDGLCNELCCENTNICNDCTKNTKLCTKFSDFYNHPLIQQAAKTPMWTVINSEKKPLDMMAIKHLHKFDMGATTFCSDTLVTLDECCDLLPRANNRTLYLNHQIHNFVVLDIEPSCPQDIRNELLQLPHLFSEISMSGKGIHLILPIPDNMWDFPEIAMKKALYDENGYFELLLHHWISFTRRKTHYKPGNKNLEEFFEKLVEGKSNQPKATVKIKTIQPIFTPTADRIVNILKGCIYRKTLSDHRGYSEFEFGHMSFLYHKLKGILQIKHLVKNETFDNNQQAWILYLAAKELFEHREKHDEERNKLPWLLYLAKEVISQSQDTKDIKKDT